MMGMGIGIVLFWIVLIGGAAWLSRALFDGSRPATTSDREPSAKEILDLRFARSELTREDYELMKHDLQ